MTNFYSSFSILCFCIGYCIASYPQYGRPYYFDAHPYPMGWEDEVQHAEQMCKFHNRRLCSSRDIDFMGVYQKRAFCKPAWAYNVYGKIIAGHISMTRAERCIKEGDIHLYPGVFPLGWHIPFGTNKPFFWCLNSKNDQKKNYECSGNGEDYEGNAAKTRSGKNCQLWKSNTPNHIGDKFGKIKTDQNFCRNPNKLSSPWCYNNDRVGWEYCDVECSPFGEFKECSVDIHSMYNFDGAKCSFSVTKSGDAKVQRLHTNLCDYQYNQVYSFRLRGSFCNLMFVKKWNYFSVSGYVNYSRFGHDYDYMILFDTSADVIVLDSGNNLTYGVNDAKLKIAQTRSPFYKNLHICTPEEVDMAQYLSPINSKYQGMGYTSTRDNTRDAKDSFLFFYSPGDKPSKKKQTWCCLDEHPKLVDTLVDANNAFKTCSHRTRNSSFLRGRTAVVYTHFRRLCTVGDLVSHYGNFAKYIQAGWVAKTETKAAIYQIDGLNYREIHGKTARPWCCDEDCLPLGYNCANDRQCCTLRCANQECAEKNAPEPGGRPIPNTPIPPLRKLLYFLAIVYSLGFLMRCCCPQRRLVSRHVKRHIE